MLGANSKGQAERQQLERLLASANFARNDRLSRYLRFVVERHLEGRAGEIKEVVIALEVFGNRNYDPKQDSVVRTEAGRLRARLAEYYLGEGGCDPVIIELPKGRYVPVFRRLNGTPRQRGARARRSWIMIALACLAMAIALGTWWRAHSDAPVPIAVMPLRNVSENSANDYFADGLTDEIIRNLSIIDGLAVRSETSSFAFKGKPRSIHDAGMQLAVDYILEGSVLRAGQQLRINVQLVRVRDDFPVWSDHFDREMTDIFAIQDEISRGIVNSLRVKLGRGRRRYETSARAYDYYLRARAVAIYQGAPGVVDAIAMYEQAISRDRSFAPAWAGLSWAYAARSILFARDHPADELEKMRNAAERAIQLDPLLAEAHEALAMGCAREGKWDEAEKRFRRAIDLDSNRSSTYCNFGVFVLDVLGRHKEALQQLRVAQKKDPISPDIHRGLAIVLMSAGRFDEAAGEVLKMPADNFRTPYLVRARLGQGRIGEVIQLLTNDTNPTKRREEIGLLGYAYARSGRRDEAEMLAAAHPDWANTQLLIFAGLGDKDRTFAALDRLFVVGTQRVGMYLNYPELALVRGDPRLQAFRRKVGLPE